MGDTVNLHGHSAHETSPHNEARAIIRLVQCSQCSLPLRTPLTLPCGNSLCRPCVPEVHQKPTVPNPTVAEMQETFTCPFIECQQDHALVHCTLDVTLTKVMERMSIEAARCRPLSTDTPTLLEERSFEGNTSDGTENVATTRSRVLNGGRLLATYTLAEIGELKYTSEITYRSLSSTGDDYQQLDVLMLNNFKEATKNELECQVCYALMLDPLTTSCGHTFCRKCVARVLDHSSLCPICRRTLSTRPGAVNERSNQRLTKLLLGLCPELVAARQEAMLQEEQRMSGETNVPLFPCTLAYPSMPLFLHIFEPRYRLMIRRAIESGDRKFGILMYNARQEPQGDLGVTHFMQYGTVSYIRNMELLPDGRSLIENVGVSRFRVKDWMWLDGYAVANVERIEDISTTEEEEIETRETSASPPPTTDLLAQLDFMSNVQLLRISTDFIVRMRAASAPWLHERVTATYGSPPDDPALFPYWFASVLPISQEEKYRLLPTRSVRERLKITARWVRRIEGQRW